MRKVLYLYGGPFHPSEEAAKILSEMLARDGRFELEATGELNALATLNTRDYAAVVIYTTGFRDDLVPAREQGLLGFIRDGGGFVGIHSANDSFRGNSAYIEMIGGEFATHPAVHEFKTTIVDHEHYITARMPDFTLNDEMYHLTNYDPSKVHLLAETPWQGDKKPMAFVKKYGKGRVAYLANGHSLEVWRNPEFQKLVVRAIAWSAGADLPKNEIRAGLLGYGPAFNMGKGHAGWINNTPGMRSVAMCDSAPARVEAAKTELPGLKAYCSSADELLAMPDVDLVVVILPHNLHAPLAIKALEAGKHVILEKPFCLSVDEANRMIDASKRAGKMLSVFHNRRWDGDYLTIQDIIARGLIGEIFHLEAGIGDYSHPGFWWRSDKAISGGVMFDWGAHFLDWTLGLIKSPITQVMGDFQKRVWHAVTNDDHGQVYVRFANGATLSLETSWALNAAAPNNGIMLAGTRGGIRNNPPTLTREEAGLLVDSTVQVNPDRGIASHSEEIRQFAEAVKNGGPSPVPGEQALMTQRILDGLYKSAQQGKEVKV